MRGEGFLLSSTPNNVSRPLVIVQAWRRSVKAGSIGIPNFKERSARWNYLLLKRASCMLVLNKARKDRCLSVLISGPTHPISKGTGW